MSQSFALKTPSASSGAGTFRQLLSSWVRSAESWLVRRHGWQDLSTLDDRMLADVGISREEVLRGAGRPFRKP
jgi:uncharacterized protein YjiS (DUF1127 family)